MSPEAGRGAPPAASGPPSSPGPGASDPGVVVLGAGYAGVTVTHAIRRSGRGTIPITVVDRHASHILRTRLYEVGRLAAADGRDARWSVPIDQVLAHDRATFVAGEVTSVDLNTREVSVGDRVLPYRSLVVCLGSVAAYYGIPGAAEYTEQVYRFSGALRLSQRLRELARASAAPGGRPVRIVVVGGGSTGTELAAEIATARWDRIVGAPAPPFEVTQVVGSVPFLFGMAPGLIEHARRLLAQAGVRSIPEVNVARVGPGEVTLKDGQVLPADAAVWCAGLEAPTIVRSLPVGHGKGGRLLVDDHLEVPGQPGLFAVGDAIELKDSETGLLVPATAQAALAEAPVAGANVVARLRGGPMRRFTYREKGVVVSVGRGRGSGTFGGITVWGRPAALLKAAVDEEYAEATSRGRRAPGV